MDEGAGVFVCGWVRVASAAVAAHESTAAARSLRQVLPALRQVDVLMFV